MTRLRARLFALAFTGWAGLANAVALGEIQVTSHLNQKLVGTIPVTTNKPGEMEGAAVELASNEEFERAGMERSEFLSALRFEVVDGYIKVTSKDIARDPFVSFLLDVRWSGGRLLREYTILLDPPAATAATPRPKAVAVPQATAEAAAASSEAPAAGPTQSQVEPTETAAAPATAVATPSPMAGNAGTYGPISPQETLWSIAYKLRPDPALTMDQVQVALFNANPQAFDHGHLGGLMKGVTLRVPTAAEIRAIDPASAKSLVASARSGGSMPARSVAKTTAKRTVKPTPKPQAEAPPPEVAPAPKLAEAPAPKTEPEPKPEPKSEPSPQAAEPSAPVTPSAAAPSSVPPPASTLSQKAPQSTTVPAESAAPAPQVSTAPAVSPAPEPAAAATPPVAEAAKPVSKSSAPEPGLVADLVDRGKGLVGEPWFLPAAAGFVLVILGVLGFRRIGEMYGRWAYERASRKAAAPRAAQAADTDSDATQVAGDAEAAEREAVTQMAPVAATQVMGAQTLQQPLQATAQQTLQQTFQQTQIQEPAQATTGGQKVDFDVTGNFANETVQINLDAGDPVSEAEFHRAYGLYDEAALLLKQALQKDPTRSDARVKLAEIYFEASKANEFVEVAKELKAELPEAEWQKIALLGTQIAPSHELFAGGATATGTVDLSFDEPSTPAPAAAPSAAPAAPAADAALEFSLDDINLDAPIVAEPAAAAPASDSLEFDLGSLSIDAPAAAAPAPSAEASAAAELNLSDFDLGEPSAAGGDEAMDLGADLTADPNTGGDESSTKLDLARAYIDMGDNDMAKSLLNEVAQQGTPQQKSEAQELLKRVPA